MFKMLIRYPCGYFLLSQRSLPETTSGIMGLSVEFKENGAGAELDYLQRGNVDKEDKVDT